MMRDVRGSLGLRLALAVLLVVATSLCALADSTHRATLMAPLNHAISALVPFRNAPFPYDGVDPETDTPFLDVYRDGRRGHTSPRGGIYWRDITYSDNRVLLALPEGFDLRRPAVLVVYFHGNNSTLEDDVIGRQQVLQQLTASGLNGALVAPQLAVNALDSSAGRFWTPGTFARFLREAAAHLGKFYKDAAIARTSFGRSPVLIVAYSGGYDPAAYALTVGGASKRIMGLILLDGAYGQADRFVDWMAKHNKRAFFFSAYTDSSAAGNAAIAAGLSAHHIDVDRQLPRALVPGLATLLSVGGAEHEDFATEAWVKQPVAWLLARVPGFTRHRAGLPRVDTDRREQK